MFEKMTPKWAKSLVDLNPITVTCHYDSTPVEWAALLARKGTITANGEAVPMEIKDVKEENGEVSATLSFTPENYTKLKAILEKNNGEDKTIG